MTNFAPQKTYYFGKLKKSNSDDYDNKLELNTSPTTGYYIISRGEDLATQGITNLREYLFKNTGKIPVGTAIAVCEKNSEGELILLEELSVPANNEARNVPSLNDNYQTTRGNMSQDLRTFYEFQVNSLNSKVNSLETENRTLQHLLSEAKESLASYKSQVTYANKETERWKDALAELKDKHKEEIQGLADSGLSGEAIAAAAGPIVNGITELVGMFLNRNNPAPVAQPQFNNGNQVQNPQRQMQNNIPSADQMFNEDNGMQQ